MLIVAVLGKFVLSIYSMWILCLRKLIECLFIIHFINVIYVSMNYVSSFFIYEFTPGMPPPKPWDHDDSMVGVIFVTFEVALSWFAILFHSFLLSKIENFCIASMKFSLLNLHYSTSNIKNDNMHSWRILVTFVWLIFRINYTEVPEVKWWSIFWQTPQFIPLYIFIYHLDL